MIASPAIRPVAARLRRFRPRQRRRASSPRPLETRASPTPAPPSRSLAPKHTTCARGAITRSNPTPNRRRRRRRRSSSSRVVSRVVVASPLARARAKALREVREPYRPALLAPRLRELRALARRERHDDAASRSNGVAEFAFEFEFVLESRRRSSAAPASRRARRARSSRASPRARSSASRRACAVARV